MENNKNYNKVCASFNRCMVESKIVIISIYSKISFASANIYIM